MSANPGPATDTIYCIRNVLPNTIYGFCFLQLVFFFPKLGKELGKLFGRNFVFRPVFLPVLPAEAGIFAMFLLLQKYGLGKLLSVNYFFRLFELKFLRVLRVNGGSDRTAQRVPRPDADDLAQNACLFASAYKGMPQAHIYAADKLGLLTVVLLKMRTLFILGGGKIGFDLFCNFVVVKDPYIIRRIFWRAVRGTGSVIR